MKFGYVLLNFYLYLIHSPLYCILTIEVSAAFSILEVNLC